MGDDPGRRLNERQTSTIVIKLTGPFERAHAQQFKKDLDAVLKKYKPLAKKVHRPLKKARKK
jgi:hypothetical protein